MSSESKSKKKGGATAVNGSKRGSSTGTTSGVVVDDASVTAESPDDTMSTLGTSPASGVRRRKKGTAASVDSSNHNDNNDDDDGNDVDGGHDIDDRQQQQQQQREHDDDQIDNDESSSAVAATVATKESKNKKKTPNTTKASDDLDGAGSLVDVDDDATATAAASTTTATTTESISVSDTSSTYYLSSYLLCRTMGVLYVIAFVSLWVQIHGLIGEAGVSPVSGFIARTKSSLTSASSASMLYFPTVFWLDQSDLTIHLTCGVATLAAVCLALDVWSATASFVCWFAYLSLSIGGQTFTTLPADYLLLESGFLLLFYTSSPSPSAMIDIVSTSSGARSKRASLSSTWRRWLESFVPLNNNPIREHPLPQAITWLFRLLLFRSNFSRGVHQLLAANDRTWRSLTAFQYIFQSQPSPTWIAWYMHQLPSWVHMALLFWVLTVEVGLVFMIFGPRMFRRTACVYLGMLHVFYILVGNQGTFHWNQLVLSLVLLDDDLFPSIVGMLQRVKEHGVFATQQRIVAERRLMALSAAGSSSSSSSSSLSASPSSSSASLVGAATKRPSQSALIKAARIEREQSQSSSVIWHSRLTILVAVLVVVLTTVPFSVMTSRAVMAPEPVLELYRFVYPFKIVNFYGPFYLVRRERMDIVVQGSIDAQNWYDYDNWYKPDSNLARRPAFASPHISRLEYRLWQAAYTDYQQEIWISRVLHRVLEGSSAVEQLFKRAPIDELGGEPEYIRAVRYIYHFTRLGNDTSDYWTREFSDIYTPSFSQTIAQMSDRRKTLRKRVAEQGVGISS